MDSALKSTSTTTNLERSVGELIECVSALESHINSLTTVVDRLVSDIPSDPSKKVSSPTQDNLLGGLSSLQDRIVFATERISRLKERL
jgi:hypothetical protein